MVVVDDLDGDGNVEERFGKARIVQVHVVVAVTVHDHEDLDQPWPPSSLYGSVTSTGVAVGACGICATPQFQFAF